MIKAKVTFNGTQMKPISVNIETGEVRLAVDLDSEKAETVRALHAPRRAGKTTQYRAWRNFHNKPAPVVLADENHPVVIDNIDKAGGIMTEPVAIGDGEWGWLQHPRMCPECERISQKPRLKKDD